MVKTLRSRKGYMLDASIQVSQNNVTTLQKSVF
jgi:hypothetical protein